MNVATCLRTAWVLALALAAALVARPAGAGTTYLLDSGSEQQIGCLWMCDCAVLMSGPVKGGFTLTRAGTDGAYEMYAVTGVNWVVQGTDGQPHTAVGQGAYSRAPTLATPQQRLELDLSLDGTPALHFDSGLVPITASWPRLEIGASRHKNLCFDTLYVVHAAPAFAPTGVPPGGATRLAAPRPSPFRDRVELAFSLDSPAAVELTIHDLAGRRVRTLVTGAHMGAGPHTVLWDGYTDDGRRVPAGVLFVRFTAGRHTDRRLLVRVE